LHYTACDHYVFWKENSTCSFLKCPNGTNCNDSSVDDLIMKLDRLYLAPISTLSTTMTVAPIPAAKNDTFIPIKTVSNACRGTTVADTPRVNSPNLRDNHFIEEKNPSPTSPEALSSQATSRNAIVPSTFTVEVSTKRLDGGTNTNRAIIDLVDTSALLAVLLFGVLFFLVTVVLFLTQAYES
ncbi:unnamed protein product, partial [Coregonus sp. 'balchen']